MKPKCFVIMGFGLKTDFATGRTLDLDKTYKNIIKPAVTEAGFDCIRADEILHSGVIDVPMYDMLFSADLVVADLSTSNLNAVFELGVRHALKPRATVIIAESQFKIPFDANHIVVRHYDHLGTDIGFDETMRMRDDLQKLVAELKNSTAIDSPVYTALRGLEQPKREATGEASRSAPPKPAAAESFGAKLEIAMEAKNSGDFDLAKKVLQQIFAQRTTPGKDGEAKVPPARVTQELALATYKSGEKAAKTQGLEAALQAYSEAIALLEKLDVATTTDPETLGLWSAIHKRRAEMETRSESERLSDLNTAIEATERGFMIKRDYYNGTNLAYLLNWRASLSSGDDRIADNVLADRVRRKVVEVSAKRLVDLEASQSSAPGQEVLQSLAEEKYWAAASHAESLVALSDEAGPDLLQKVVSSAPAKWMADTTLEQLGKVQRLLAKAQQ